VFFSTLFRCLEIDVTGPAISFNGVQILALPTAQWIKQYLMAEFPAQVCLIVPDDDFCRLIQKNNFTVRSHDHDTH
jgi:hypothetical protein